jgi:hypothetical protein
MDRAETIVATKRITRWPESWKADLVELTPHEREVVMTLVALVDARPCDETWKAE